MIKEQKVYKWANCKKSVTIERRAQGTEELTRALLKIRTQSDRFIL